MGSPMCASHAVGRAEAGVALSIKRSGIERRNLLAERDAKLLQKPIYIQILRFIFALCKSLKYNTLVK